MASILESQFDNEVSQIKVLLNKNGYPQELVNRTISNHLKNLNKTKLFGPQKCVVTLKLPFIKNAVAFEKNIKQIVRSSYFAAKPRIIFTSIFKIQKIVHFVEVIVNIKIWCLIKNF